LGARHLALNADEQLQLRQLNGQYDSIVVSKTHLSLQMSISIIALIILAKIRGITFSSLIRSNRMVAVVFYPTDTITNSDLELAGGILHLDAIAQYFDVRECTLLSKTDNLATLDNIV